MNRPDFAILHAAIAAINAPEGDEYIKEAACSRLLELETLVSALTGKGLTWSQHLGPITKAIDTTMRQIELANIETVTDEDNIDQLADREECEQLIQQARVAALSMITHLNAAITRIPTLRVVK